MDTKVSSWRLARDGRIHRKRCIQYPNGDIYNGEVVNGMRNGFGTLKTSNLKYTGSFKNNLFDGKGTLEWSQFKENDIDIINRKYDGHFCKGRRHGDGLFHDGKGGIWKGSWKNDVFEGIGSVTYENGETLQGRFLNGKLHDTDAKILFSNGDLYEGSVHFGSLHSVDGAYLLYKYGKNCNNYTGQFEYDSKSGIGTRRYIDGSVYRGNFYYNRINGQGTMKYGISNNVKQYSGMWQDGFFHGEGELTFRDDFCIKSYRGKFHKGLYNGYGVLVYRDNSSYEGEFNSTNISDQFVKCSPWNGNKHGHGTRTWASGNCFTGFWKNNKMLKGKYEEHDKKLNYCSTYVGSFVDDRKSGTMCRQIWRSIDGRSFRDPCFRWKHEGNETCRYVGEYKNGYFNSNGTFSCSDGRKYEGGWKHGRPHGYGIATLTAIGTCDSLYKPKSYEGEWFNGLRHGKGKYLMTDGSEKVGHFVNGHMKH